MRDLFVRRVYTHKNGISITVDIDYVKKEISLVEKDGTNKKWVFAERGPEYMHGWRNILIAMEWAVQQVQQEFKAITDKEHEDLAKLFMELDKSLKKGGKQ